MPSDKDSVNEELASLQKEVQQLKDARQNQQRSETSSRSASITEEPTVEVSYDDQEQSQPDTSDLEQTVSELIEQIEDEVITRPAVAILGALFLGIVIGATLRR